MRDETETDDVYSEEESEKLVEEDEIDDVEAGFVMGYREGGKMVKCANCGKLLADGEFVEEEISDEIYRFCCSGCAEAYVNRRKVL